MTQALYRKWRPKTWSEVVGQEHIVQTLKNAITNDRVGHAYLFSGPRGTGKTTTARLLAKAVNCTAAAGTEKPCDTCDNCLSVDNGNFLDLIEIDAASNTSVDDVRDLRDKINFSPNLGKFKVYVIDEVHMLSNAAFNALLKTLEEPPAHAIFILATTEIHKIPATVMSRCQRHEFRRLPVPVIANLLEGKAAEEGFAVDKEVFTLLARQATGSLRDGISLLDQLASTNQQITIELAENVLGTAASQNVINLVGSIVDANLPAGLDIIQKTLDAGSDPRQFARQMVDYLRNLLLIRVGSANLIEAGQDVRDVMAGQAKKVSNPVLLNALNEFNLAAGENRSSSWQPGLALELALARTIEGKAEALPAIEQPVTVKVPVTTPVSHAVFEKPAQKIPPIVSTQPTQSFSESNQVDIAQPAEISVNAGDGSPISNIQQNWKKVIEAVRKISPGTSGLVNSSQVVEIKDGCLILGFASDILKTKMETNDHLEIARRAVSQVTGVNLPIRCVVKAGKSTTSNDTQLPQNSLVGSALRDLGGQVVEVKDVDKNNK